MTPYIGISYGSIGCGFPSTWSAVAILTPGPRPGRALPDNGPVSSNELFKTDYLSAFSTQHSALYVLPHQGIFCLYKNISEISPAGK
jgi:hypothetical protein